MEWVERKTRVHGLSLTGKRGKGPNAGSTSEAPGLGFGKESVDW